MLSIPTADSDSLHPEDGKYSKRLKEATQNSYLRDNPHIGHLTGIKGNSPRLFCSKIMFDLSSDHSPILITLTSHVLNQEKQPSLSNRNTNREGFRHLINQRLT
jgi:hypothetical protein